MSPGMTDFDPRRSSSPSDSDGSSAEGAPAVDALADTVSAPAAPRSAVTVSAAVPAPAPLPAVDLARRRLASKRAHRDAMRSLMEWAHTFHLTPARFEMLAAISSHPLGTTQRTLSKALSISQGTTSRMVARLVRLELVRVDPNPDDARKRLLRVTEEGERRLLAAQASFFEAGFGAPPDPELLN
jgi:DNA-binding MarR family transcriptional regulator